MRTSYAAINNALWEAFYASRYLFPFTQQQNEYSRRLGYELDGTAFENITWATTTLVEGSWEKAVAIHLAAD